MKKLSVKIIVAFILNLWTISVNSQPKDSTYAERLLYPKGAKVLILHVDDAGMSYESNEGTRLALTKGAATSCSVMMPCSWVPDFVQFLQKNPAVDAGLHLTLTSEWHGYKWAPVAANNKVAGLMDTAGYLWPSVADVVQHATATEVENEIRSQYDKAISMGFIPTHFDSHMGTLFATPSFLEKYITLGIEKKIPVMLPAGHNSLITKQMNLPPQQLIQMQQAGRLLWEAGLPVLDDLHNESYDWKIPPGVQHNEKQVQQFKTKKYIEALAELKPGVTMMIMHCTITSPLFKFISGSGPTRQGDLLAMLDPAFKAALAQQKIVLTTWRELKERRDRVAN